VAIPTLDEWKEQNQGENTSRGALGLAIGGLFAVVACVLGGAVLVPSLIRMQGQSQLSTAEGNLKTIIGAMQQYHDTWGSFPPAVVYGPDGTTPYHSWRVLLLPYLEQDGLYTQYDRNQPWNSPNNTFVMQQMPAVYSLGTPDGTGMTTFVVVTGDRTMFPDKTTTSRSDALKGPGATALVVESAFSPVIWTEPKDLSFDNMNFDINDPNGSSVSGAAPEGALVGMVDGSTQILHEQLVAANYVQQLLLRDSAPFGGASVGVATVFTPPMDASRRFEPVLFGDLANQRMDENLHGGQEGNTLDSLGIGEQNLGGVDFKVAPKILCLGNKEGVAAHLPERIDGIPVDKLCERIHFLHATGWKAPKDGTPIGHYEIRYDDGTVEMAKIVYGVDVRDWWDSDGTAAVTDGRMVWTGRNTAIMQQSPSATQVRLFMSTWNNPRPKDKIKSIDFVGYKATECAPFCVAISIDNPRDAASEDITPAEATPETAAEAPAETSDSASVPAEAEVNAEMEVSSEDAVAEGETEVAPVETPAVEETQPAPSPTEAPAEETTEPAAP
jgi:hypothetical protein